MRSLLVSIAMLVGTHCAFSQLSKGNFVIGGTAGYRYEFDDGGHASTISLSPNVSYFILNRFSVGIVAPLSTSNTTFLTKPHKGYITMNYAIGPALRYYFPFKNSWAFFPTVDYSYGWSKYDGTLLLENLPVSTDPSDPLLLGNVKLISTVNTLRVGAGLTYFIAGHIGLEGVLYYQSLSSTASIIGANPGTISSSGFSFKLGLQVYLIKRKG